MPRRKRPQLSLLKVRSALTNGRAISRDVDGRSLWMRRLRDLIELHTSDLGGDISEAEQRLVRKAAMLELQTEIMERNWALRSEGEAGSKSLDDYIRATNTMRRVLEALGLQRRQKDVTPSLSEYLEQREAAE
jgi:hypothetical protein